MLYQSLLKEMENINIKNNESSIYIINSRGSALNAVINGSRKHHKNWIVI